ncbi:MAG: sugar phosphate isomerase/epimerase [Pirellulales bacterium]|nr:sugar phosphate isomerase/epimerase [Pirellulales bacterium]
MHPHHPSRRELLQASLAALAAAGFATGRALAAPFAGMPMGIQSYTFRGFDVLKALDETQKLGLHYVEMFEAHFPSKSSPAEIDKMLAEARRRDIKIIGYGVNPFTKDHEKNRKMFEFAQRVGIRNLSADPTEDAFDSLDKLVEEFDIRIAIHNHGPGARYNKIADVLTAIEGHHPKIGACADLGHYIRSAEDPVRAIRLFKGRLYGVHLKDFAEQKANARGVILGEGHLDVKGVFQALREVEFPADGSLSLEYEEKEADPRDDVRQCFDVAAKAADALA